MTVAIILASLGFVLSSLALLLALYSVLPTYSVDSIEKPNPKPRRHR